MPSRLPQQPPKQAGACLPASAAAKATLLERVPRSLPAHLNSFPYGIFDLSAFLGAASICIITYHLHHQTARSRVLPAWVTFAVLDCGVHNAHTPGCRQLAPRGSEREPSAGSMPRKAGPYRPPNRHHACFVYLDSVRRALCSRRAAF